MICQSLGGGDRLNAVFLLTDKNGKTETVTIYNDEQGIN